jgi:hypothetical protein
MNGQIVDKFLEESAANREKRDAVRSGWFASKNTIKKY